MEEVSPEVKRQIRNAKNSERIKKLYHDDEEVRKRMKANSKRRYDLLKAAMAATAAAAATAPEAAGHSDASSH